MSNSYYTITVDADQLETLDKIKVIIKAANREDVFRKALGLAALISEITAKGQRLGVVNQDGTLEELISFK